MSNSRVAHYVTELPPKKYSPLTAQVSRHTARQFHISRDPDCEERTHAKLLMLATGAKAESASHKLSYERTFNLCQTDFQTHPEHDKHHRLMPGLLQEAAAQAIRYPPLR